MRSALLAALLMMAAPALAATVSAPATGGVVAHAGQMLRDAGGLRLGSVDTVQPDGSVSVIVEGRYVVIPANTLVVADGKLMTSLSKKALPQLN